MKTSLSPDSSTRRRRFSLFTFLFSLSVTPSLFTFLFSLFIASAFAPAALAADSPTVCNPYTFAGRITDAHRVAFDASRVAVLTASAEDGTLLARSKTFYRDDSTRNYFLAIPMADSSIPGAAVLGENVAIAATDPSGKTWSAVIDPAVIGIPGTVAEVDIVLAEDANGDGIDDDLFAELLAGWEDSEFYSAGSTYDPASDSDGDGVSDLDEAYLGTNPFNSDDVLSIISFNPVPPSITFKTDGGRTFAVEVSSTLDPASAVWRPVCISTTPGDASSTRTLYTPPVTTDRAEITLYLFPTSSPSFFRLAPQ